MRALQFTKFGDPSELRLVERSQPYADASSAIVQVHAASVNPSDVKNVAGRMEQTILPRVPGRDYSGVVVDGPSDWIGRSVWGTGGDVGFTRDGSHAEYISVPTESLALKPESLSHDEAGSIGVAFVTAWTAVMEYAALSRRETIAIIGATGSVGSAAMQIARRAGARVIAINRTQPAAGSWLATFPDISLDAHSPHITAQVHALSHGNGADVVLNAAGGDMFEVGLRLLARRGRQVEITSPSTRRVSFDLVDFYHNESQLFGVDTLKQDLVASSRVLEKIRADFDAGHYRPPTIATRLSLSAARDAYQIVDQGGHGKVVITPLS